MPPDSPRLKLEPPAGSSVASPMNDQHGSREALMMIAGAVALALAVFLGSFAVEAFMLTADPAGDAFATR